MIHHYCKDQNFSSELTISFLPICRSKFKCPNKRVLLGGAADALQKKAKQISIIVDWHPECDTSAKHAFSPFQKYNIGNNDLNSSSQGREVSSVSKLLHSLRSRLPNILSHILQGAMSPNCKNLVASLGRLCDSLSPGTKSGLKYGYTLFLIYLNSLHSHKKTTGAMAKLFLPIALQLCCILLAATTCRANARLKATQHTSIYTKRNTRSLLQGTDCEYDSECSSDDTYFCDNGYCTRSECVTDDDCLDDYYCDGGTCYALNDTEDAPYDSPSPSPTQDYAPYEPYDSPSPSPSPRPTYTPVPTTTRPPVTTPSLTPTTPIGNQTPSSGTSGTASPSYSGVTTPSSRPTNPIGNQTTSSGVSGTASPSPSDGGSGGGGLSVGAIVGIVVGIVAVVGGKELKFWQ